MLLVGRLSTLLVGRIAIDSVFTDTHSHHVSFTINIGILGLILSSCKGKAQSPKLSSSYISHTVIDNCSVFRFKPTVLLTVALLLQCCVHLSSVTYVLWLNGAYYRKTEEANRKWPMGNRMVT